VPRRHARIPEKAIRERVGDRSLSWAASTLATRPSSTLAARAIPSRPLPGTAEGPTTSASRSTRAARCRGLLLSRRRRRTAQARRRPAHRASGPTTRRGRRRPKRLDRLGEATSSRPHPTSPTAARPAAETTLSPGLPQASADPTFIAARPTMPSAASATAPALRPTSPTSSAVLAQTAEGFSATATSPRRSPSTPELAARRGSLRRRLRRRGGGRGGLPARFLKVCAEGLKRLGAALPECRARHGP
jgi:hypothetical protein